ncbi:hypothetical protein HOT72_gp046 [Gordonia phage Apricot]|uniref:Uncharacterized protein n=1 Tax=Gordonia phage Apricot TaxID=2250319 RepID=A0A345L153_9CAUD|nr:hypothetical protein HOT72_gp046 [Gordonia phage Apricot]AXH49005.1 hypothetical protein SEA_APRICOT_46 [Gordonia phage Apricot]
MLRVSDLRILVELRGLEPLYRLAYMQVRGSFQPNW